MINTMIKGDKSGTFIQSSNFLWEVALIIQNSYTTDTVQLYQRSYINPFFNIVLYISLNKLLFFFGTIPYVGYQHKRKQKHHNGAMNMYSMRYLMELPNVLWTIILYINQNTVLNQSNQPHCRHHNLVSSNFPCVK